MYNIITLKHKTPRPNERIEDTMLNQIMLMGRLTADPEIRTTEDSRYCKFSIAVQRSKRKGENNAETDFFNCIAWNRNADVIADWYSKGDMLMIVGTLRNSTYEKNGEKRVSTEIVVREIHFTVSKKKSTDSEYEDVFADEDTLF
jgi:single-strand DNA-binding protein